MRALFVGLAYGVALLYLAWRLGRWDWVRAGKAGRSVLVLGAVIVLPLVLALLLMTIPLTYWLVMPAAAWLIGRDAWRHSAGAGRWVAMSALGVSCAWIGWEGGVNKIYYDALVNRMCKKDGGVRVYEQVRLPAEKFNQWGQPNFYKPTQGENALGPEYIFKWDLHYIRTGNPSLHRSQNLVLRRSDGKVLGESIGYSRGGGDLPGPWQPSSFSCPAEYGDIPLLMKIFVQSNKD